MRRLFRGKSRRRFASQGTYCHLRWMRNLKTSLLSILRGVNSSPSYFRQISSIRVEYWDFSSKSQLFLPYYRYKRGLIYTSDAADDLLCVDLGGRRIIK